MTLDQLWKKKLLVIGALSVWGGLPYHLIQNVNFAKVFTMPTLKVDQLIPLNLNTVWIYHSWLLLPLLTIMLLPHTGMLKRFGWGLAAVNALSFLVFLIFPTRVSRPPLGMVDDPPLLYEWTVLVDKDLNACPSLHASVTLFCSIFFLCRMWRAHTPWRWLGVALQLSWAGGILWSTLATRQHVFLDMIAGSSLGTLVAFAALTLQTNSQAESLPRDWERAF